MSEKHRYNLERWSLIIDKRIQSGQTVTEWCKENQVSKNAYYYWLRNLQRESLKTALSELPTQISSNTSFVEITRQETESSEVESERSVHPAA